MAGRDAVYQGISTLIEQPSSPGTESLRQAGASPVPELDWVSLVQSCLRGDDAAWAELVRNQHRRVYSLCYRFSGSRQDAEDLTQEVFLKVYRNLHSFNLEKGRFQTWLTTVTRNLLVDHFRRSQMQRITSSIEDAPEHVPEALSSHDPSPHDAAVRRELERLVQEALTKLPLEFREAVILRDLEQMDYREIAQILRIPEGTVKSRISRGRAELARLLERNKGQVV
jgi:RNA polymerase sigma-70 factor (ECF subfamily)